MSSTIRKVVRDRLRDVLEEDGFADPGRSDDQSALALALRSDDVDHSGGLVLHRRIERVEAELLVRVERRQIVEIDAVADGVRIVVIDRNEAGEREITFAILRPPDLALDRIAGAEAEFPHLVGRDIDVVRAGEVIGFRRAKEAEAVGQHFDRAHAHDLLAVLGLDLQDREHQLLLAKRRRAFDAKRFGRSDQIGGALFLEVFEVHGAYSGSGIRRAKRWRTRLLDCPRGNGGRTTVQRLGAGKNQVNRLRAAQNGFTITRMTMIAVATPGISFMMRSALPLTGRSPRASFLP
jgi:hypothetical protein